MEGAGAGEEAPRRPAALPWKVRLMLLGLNVVGGLSMRRDGTINRRLFNLFDRRARASASPDAHGVRSADVDIDASRDLWARVFSPSPPPSPDEASPPKLPVVVYFHGGGFALLSAASLAYDAMCRRLCRELRAVVVSVDYRLAPEHRCPAAYDDGVEVLRHLPSTLAAAAAGILDGGGGVFTAVDLSRCFIAGDSAGGNIAHHVARRWTTTTEGESAGTNSSGVRLAGVVLVQPYFGGEERTEAEGRLDGKVPVVTVRGSDWMWRAFLPAEGADRDHPAAHVTDENAGLGDGFPPAMVVVGGLDPLQDWQRRYAQVLRRRNGNEAVRVVEFPDAIHTFFFFPELPDSGRLVQAMKAFMDGTDSDASDSAVGSA